MQNLLENEDIDHLITNNKAVILQFGTFQCTPCIAIKAKLDQWNLKHTDVIMRYISIEDYPEAAAQHDILSSPTICLYIDGKLLLKESGYFSLEEFLKRTERYLSVLESEAD